MLEEQCLKRQGDRLRGAEGTIEDRLTCDLDKLSSLPPVAYDACETRSTQSTSLSLVRYRCVDYSIPAAYAYRDVLVRGYVHEVVISYGAEVIARHSRSYEREDIVFDPLHYLVLLEQKIGAPARPSARAGTAHDRTADQGGKVPGNEEPGQLRPCRDPVSQ